MQVKLSELRRGESGRIESIEGNLSFRRRIVELGFVPGSEVTSVRRAPLEDPAAYRVRGTNISLREREASKILVSRKINFKEDPVSDLQGRIVSGPITRQPYPGNSISVALVGNPNSGKTSIFNVASRSKEKTANYSGVTVSIKEATIRHSGFEIRFIDLPGTYSLNSESADEAYVPAYLIENPPDLILNVVDATRLERNLFLTTQLIDLGLPMILALNMFDELEVSEKANFERLGGMLGFPVMPTVARKGSGIKDIIQVIIDFARAAEPGQRKVNIRLTREVEEGIASLEGKISGLMNSGLIGFDIRFTRFTALNLLEGNSEILDQMDFGEQAPELEAFASSIRNGIERLYPGGLAELISGDRYGFIEGALKENQIRTGSKKDSLSHRIDNILTHKVFSLPIFFSIIFFMFFMTFSLGNYPVGWLEFLFSKAGDWMSGILPLGTIRDLIVEGMIPGIGAVAVFLPNIILLFLFISILEDTGYMARTAFIVDRIMHKAGLHGKSFIPLLIGFGCNVPAVMATRSIEDPRNRLLTMMVIPFMSCSARLPVYVLFISAYFASMRSLILFSLYLTGIVLAWLSAILFRKVFFRERSAPFVMELPPYRVPTAKAILKHMWLKTWYFIKKMGGIILLASVLIWALGYFPVGNSDKFNGENKERIENSYISELGKGIQPVFKPLGFDWKMSVSILAGLPAKEIVVSTLGVLDQDMTESDLPMLRSMSFMLFILLYFPCIGTLAMIRRESGRVVWSIFTMVYTTSVAWLVSFAVFQVGSFLA